MSSSALCISATGSGGGNTFSTALMLKEYPRSSMLTPASSGHTGFPGMLDSCSGRPTVGGEGFILSVAERNELLQKDAISTEVIRPFLTGQDINQHPEQQSDRFAIDFQDFDEATASGYQPCWHRLYDTVRLQRKGNKIPQREQYWWRYIGRQEKLYAAIDGFPRVLVCGEVSKYWGVSWVPPGQVFAGKVVVLR